MDLDPSLSQQFDEDGFLHIPGFMTPAEMDEAEAELDHFVREVVPGLSKTMAMYEDYDHPESLKYVTMPEEQAGYFVQLRDSERMAGLARALLRDEVTPNLAAFFNKPPGWGKPTPPHQDGYYFCLVPNEAVTLWLAVDDIDEENGAVTYVSGSRKHGVQPHGASGVLGFSQGLTDRDLTSYGAEVVCHVQRGDLLVHHSLTIHWAGANDSSRLRRALAFAYRAQRAQVDPELQRRYQESVRRQREEQGVI